MRVQLPLAHGRRTLHRLSQVWQGPTDTSSLTQEAIDGAAGTWQPLPTSRQLGIARQIVQQGFGSRCTPQAFGWLIAQLEDALDHPLADALTGVLARPRLPLQDGLILWGGFTQAFAPLLDPAQRHAHGLGILLARPAGVLAQQTTQIGAGGVVYYFHAGTLLGRQQHFYHECTCLLPSLSTMWVTTRGHEVSNSYTPRPLSLQDLGPQAPQWIGFPASVVNIHQVSGLFRQCA